MELEQVGTHVVPMARWAIRWGLLRLGSGVEKGLYRSGDRREMESQGYG